jgi:hypothetical protein
MNLDNFEKYIDGRIVNRGLSYYKSGRVGELEYDGDCYTAQVDGSRVYTVQAHIDESGEILDSSCDCPYEFGEYCKHEAAFFYALCDAPLAELRQKAAKNTQSLSALLAQQDKNTLVAVLLEYARKNIDIRQNLRFRFSKQPDVLGYAKHLIESSIQAVEEDGYIEYRDTDSAAEGGRQSVRLIYDTTDIISACQVFCLVMREMGKLECMCDDSNGAVGGVIEDALIALRKRLATIPSDFPHAEELADTLVAFSREDCYSGVDERALSIIRSLIPLCGNQTVRHLCEQRLSESQTHDHYERQEAQQIQYEIIEQYNGEQAALSYLKAHLDNDYFRSQAIENAIKKENFNVALQLCLDGEHIDAEKRPGLVNHWREYRYQIYQLQHDVDAMKHLAETFVVDEKDFNYFLKLKKLYTETEWQTVLPPLLEKVSRDKWSSIYTRILVNEHLQKDLLDYCKQYNDGVLDLYKHLLPEYAEETAQILAALIEKNQKVASNRTDYHKVASIIRIYAEVCGQAKAQEIADALKITHKRKRAFVDELNRAFDKN